MGLERPARADEWAAVATALRRRDCPVVALVPYPERRWPRALRRRLTIFLWDRATGATHVHARVGAGLGR